MEFLSSLSRRRSSSRNFYSGEERGETAVFAGYELGFELDFLVRNGERFTHRPLSIEYRMYRGVI